MLPLPHQQCFQKFQQALVQIQERVRLRASAVDLRPLVTDAQQLFQSQVLRLDLDSLPPELERRVYSFQVEIDKQLRLLGMDLTFLQVARQGDTIDQRRRQLEDRVGILQKYCDALLDDAGKDR